MKYWGADENDVGKLAGDERSSGCISSLDVQEEENMQNGEMQGKRVVCARNYGRGSFKYCTGDE